VNSTSKVSHQNSRTTAQGGDPGRIASVASFFVSRIDVAVDGLIEERLRETNEADRRAALAGLRGKSAIANAKLAYRRHQRLFAGARWEKLRAKGAHVQRLLWASTGTKNPAYSDVLYVEELVGADTVNTLPPATMDAFRDARVKSGERSETLTTDFDVVEV
jgi:transaldolase / glucose-6-phosphate isomerase